MSIKEANADVTVLAKRFAAAYPKSTQRKLPFASSLFPLPPSKDFRKTLYFLLGAVGLLAAHRLRERREHAFRHVPSNVRRSLPFGHHSVRARPQLFRQLIVESLLFCWLRRHRWHPSRSASA